MRHASASVAQNTEVEQHPTRLTGRKLSGVDALVQSASIPEQEGVALAVLGGSDLFEHRLDRPVGMARADGSPFPITNGLHRRPARASFAAVRLCAGCGEHSEWTRGRCPLMEKQMPLMPGRMSWPGSPRTD
jgi:hypothetical protein